MMETQMFIELINMDDPETFFRVHLENDYYEADIRYLSKAYKKHLEDGGINRDDLLISTKPKSRHLPEILFLLRTASTKERIGIIFPEGMFVGEEEMEQFGETIPAAHVTIREIKNAINRYFPGVLENSQEKE